MLEMDIPENLDFWTITEFPRNIYIVLTRRSITVIKPFKKPSTKKYLAYELRFTYYSILQDTKVMINKYPDEDKYSQFLSKFKSIVREVFHEDVYLTKFQARKIFERTNIVLPNNKKTYVRAYMIDNYIKPGDANISELSIDFENVYSSLCNSKVSINYMNTSVKPVNQKDDETILLVLGYDAKTNSLLGIRVVKLNFSQKLVYGLFACSTGMGTIIQNITEELLRTTLHIKFEEAAGEVVYDSMEPFALNPRDDLNMEELEMKFQALPEAVSFWKKMGFNKEPDTNPGQVVDEMANVNMFKKINPSRENSGVQDSKRKASRTPKSNSETSRPPSTSTSNSNSRSSSNSADPNKRSVTSRAINSKTIQSTKRMLKKKARVE